MCQKPVQKQRASSFAFVILSRMNLAERIESAEYKYRQKLEEYFIKKWGDTALFSHDITHHRRVWHYAKELLSEAEKNEGPGISFYPDKLLIACYLHDLGMSVDISERHGVHSSNFCREFISINGFSESEFDGVFFAIENHDNKEYSLKDNSVNLLSLLTIADDLDAFGHIGILRYFEIYLKRGIHPSEIGYKIRDNASKRLTNFRSVFGNNYGLYLKQYSRFMILDDFFKDYNQQIGDPSLNA